MRKIFAVQYILLITLLSCGGQSIISKRDENVESYNPKDSTSIKRHIVSIWRAEGTASDSVGTNDGTIQNAEFDNGKKGQAFKFDGTEGKYVSFSNNIPDNAFTISAWVYTEKKNGSNGSVIASNYSHATKKPEKGFTLGNNIGKNNQFYFTIWNENGISASTTYNDFYNTNKKKWVHVAGVFKGGKYVRLYINGIKVAEDSTGVPSKASFPSNIPLRIGARADKNNLGSWKGRIDEIIIHNIALDEDKIRAIMNFEYIDEIDDGSDPINAAGDDLYSTYRKGFITRHIAKNGKVFQELMLESVDDYDSREWNSSDISYVPIHHSDGTMIKIPKENARFSQEIVKPLNNEVGGYDEYDESGNPYKYKTKSHLFVPAVVPIKYPGYSNSRYYVVQGKGDNPLYYGGRAIATFALENKHDVSNHSLKYARKMIDYLTKTEMNGKNGFHIRKDNFFEDSINESVKQEPDGSKYNQNPNYLLRGFSNEELMGMTLGIMYYLKEETDSKYREKAINIRNRMLDIVCDVNIYTYSHSYMGSADGASYETFPFNYPICLSARGDEWANEEDIENLGDAAEWLVHGAWEEWTYQIYYALVTSVGGEAEDVIPGWEWFFYDQILTSLILVMESDIDRYDKSDIAETFMDGVIEDMMTTGGEHEENLYNNAYLSVIALLIEKYIIDSRIVDCEGSGIRMKEKMCDIWDNNLPIWRQIVETADTVAFQNNSILNEYVLDEENFMVPPLEGVRESGVVQFESTAYKRGKLINYPELGEVEKLTPIPRAINTIVDEVHLLDQWQHNLPLRTFYVQPSTNVLSLMDHTYWKDHNPQRRIGGYFIFGSNYKSPYCWKGTDGDFKLTSPGFKFGEDVNFNEYFSDPTIKKYNHNNNPSDTAGTGYYKELRSRGHFDSQVEGAGIDLLFLRMLLTDINPTKYPAPILPEDKEYPVLPFPGVTPMDPQFVKYVSEKTLSSNGEPYDIDGHDDSLKTISFDDSKIIVTASRTSTGILGTDNPYLKLDTWKVDNNGKKNHLYSFQDERFSFYRIALAKTKSRDNKNVLITFEQARDDIDSVWDIFGEWLVCAGLREFLRLSLWGIEDSGDIVYLNSVITNPECDRGDLIDLAVMKNGSNVDIFANYLNSDMKNKINVYGYKTNTGEFNYLRTMTGHLDSGDPENGENLSIEATDNGVLINLFQNTAGTYRIYSRKWLWPNSLSESAYNTGFVQSDIQTIGTRRDSEIFDTAIVKKGEKNYFVMASIKSMKDSFTDDANEYKMLVIHSWEVMDDGDLFYNGEYNTRDGNQYLTPFEYDYDNLSIKPLMNKTKMFDDGPGFVIVGRGAVWAGFDENEKDDELTRTEFTHSEKGLKVVYGQIMEDGRPSIMGSNYAGSGESDEAELCDVSEDVSYGDKKGFVTVHKTHNDHLSLTLWRYNNDFMIDDSFIRKPLHSVPTQAPRTYTKVERSVALRRLEFDKIKIDEVIKPRVISPLMIKPKKAKKEIY